MESVSVVLLAFLEQRTWRQAELARRARVERKTLVRLLNDLHHAGLPLTRDEDPPQVYWSVPQNWFPGAVAFRGQELGELVRLLHRMPRSEKRDILLRQIGYGAPSMQQMHDGNRIQSGILSAEEEARLSLLQQSVEQCSAVRVQYFTQSRGELAWLSVHRIVLDSGRLIATSHREDRLKWFRMNGILAVRLDSQEPYRSVLDADIVEFLNESVDGYHSGESAVRSVFRARLPEAEWLQEKLPLMRAVENDGVIVFTTFTSGLLALARLLVGLGGAVAVDTPELRLVVAELARAALDANS
jgi:predicted DNA-binding transcriptional regulator YafY